MISYLRKLRGRLIAENRFAKYLLYTLGEIILVVIGILIALQINNWNEQRKLHTESREIYQRLYLEVSSNQRLLDNQIREQNFVTTRLEALLGLMGPDIDMDTLDTKNVEELIKSLHYIPKYNPEMGTLNSILSSGKMAILDSEALKKRLNQLPGLIKKYDYTQSILYDISKNQILNYIASIHPFRDLQVDNNERIGRSKFAAYLKLVLTSMELESFAELKRVDSGDAVRQLEKIRTLQNEIIDLLDISIHD